MAVALLPRLVALVAVLDGDCALCAGSLLACADDTVHWRPGLRAAPPMLGPVRPRRLPRAVGVLVAAAPVRRSSR